jgi:hypothetical protein
LALFVLIALAKPLLWENPNVARSIPTGAETKRFLDPGGFDPFARHETVARR